MLFNFKKGIGQWWAVLFTAPIVSALAIAASSAGLFQLLELATLDQFFRWRRSELPDERILIVTIDESDITKLGHWPMSDEVLTKLLTNLKNNQPRAIGIDLYRDLAVEPGHEALLEVYKSTPNLIGVEKRYGNQVAPPPILKDLNQVALSDVLLDADGKVRRSLLSVNDKKEGLKLSLGAKLALLYLQNDEISLQPIDASKGIFELGKGVFMPLTENSGGYVKADAAGYQLLMNFRGSEHTFQTVSLTDILENRIPGKIIRDRIVLIGAVADSLKDFVQTPYDSSLLGSARETPGVFIHANAASQILSAAIEGRPLIQVWDEEVEWLWIFIWSGIGSIMVLAFLKGSLVKKNVLPKSIVLCTYIVLAGGSAIAIGYFAFLRGWWIPTIAPLFALAGSGTVISVYHSAKIQREAFIDGLTKIANRRYFDKYLDRQWELQQQNRTYLSVLLCDVDHFKFYNDTYGHQAGDECLQQVAQALSMAVRKTDLVARYGGEEFVVVMPKTSPEEALELGKIMLEQVKALEIPHAKSTAGEYVTLSCGVASIFADTELSPAYLVSLADEALYEAKENGRARVVLSHYNH